MTFTQRVLERAPAATPEVETQTPPEPLPAAPVATSPTPVAQAATLRPSHQIADEVSLDRKIGQMVMLGFRGLEVSDQLPIVRDIRMHHLGGVVLFDYDVPTSSPIRNIQSPAQVKALIAGLQSVASGSLLVAIDQEGGRVRRLKEEHGFPAAPSPQSLGEANDVSATYNVASTIARTLAEHGVNLNFAPVVDLNTNPDNPIIGKIGRSFSADPAVVTAHAQAFIRAHHEHGVLCALKHFPGHGSSTADSHQGFVDITRTWSSAELEPYASIIKAEQVDAIMTAHVFNATLDPQYPATLSEPTITGVLRNRLSYDGVVVSDDIQMEAIRQHYGYEAAVAAAIRAGVDIILIGNNTIYEEDVAGRTVGIIQQLVRDGKISETRITEAYQRIQRLKSRIGGADSHR